ncbi:MAG: hypothetical protein H6744_01500 [Deltaproteobacteria bacterium]|nr:hypothetical protein [Deltaproteobacteria bacterium]
MDIVDQILDFLRRLVKSRVDGVQTQAKTKYLNAQARTKAKVAGSFNKAVDGGIERAKGAAQSKAGRTGEAGAAPDAKGQSK